MLATTRSRFRQSLTALDPYRLAVFMLVGVNLHAQGRAFVVVFGFKHAGRSLLTFQMIIDCSRLAAVSETFF